MLFYPLKYLTCIVYIIFMIFFCQSVGYKIQSKKRFTSNLIVGYIVYTALQGIGGIVIQILHLDYMYYQIYMCLLIICLSLYKFKLKKIDLKVIFINILSHIKKYYPLYILAGILLFFSLINIGGLWSANRQDDGWYLTQIEQLPKMGAVYTIHAPTGYSYIPSLMRVVNTYEMESAFYASMLNIPASIFVKVALAYFQYFLLSVCVCEFSFQIFKKQSMRSLCYFIPVCILLFGLTDEMLRNDTLLVLTDDWQFNTAMGYGSSVVRTMGIFLFLPILQKKLFCKSTILYILAVCFAMMTKGSQALPVLYLVIAALVILYVLIELKGKTQKIVLSLGVMLLLVFPRIGTDFWNNFESAYSIFINNFSQTYLFAIAIIVGYVIVLLKYRSRIHAILPFFLVLSLSIGNVLLIALLVFASAFSIENEYMKKWNYFMIIIAILMFVPGMNTLFIDLSVYDFVVERALTLYSITFIITSFVYFIYFLSNYQVKELKLIALSIVIGISISVYFVIQYQKTYSITHALAVIKNNAELIPTSTLQLSDALEQLAKDKGSAVNVVMPVSYAVDQKPHYPYVLLRLHNQNVRSVSAIARYGQ